MKFSYTARNTKGEIQTGAVEAKDKNQAIDILQRHNLVLLSIKEKDTLPFWVKEIKIFQRVSGKDLVLFSRQLSVLFSAKIPLTESIKTTARQTANPYFQEILVKMAGDVEAGMLLSKALEKYPRIFSSFYVNMVKSGEFSGTLENVLNYLADYLEKQFYLNSRVKGAMVYPAFILTGFVIVGVLLLTVIIPQLTSILKESGQELPWTTKIVIAASDTAKNYGLSIFVLLTIIIGGAIHYVRDYQEGRRLWDGLKIKAPVIGQIFQKLYLSRLSDSLSTLISGGIPILQALQVSADVIDNLVLKEIIMEARDEVRGGNTISSVFRKYSEIPPMVTNMIAVGEQTGTVDMILKKLSAFYVKEVDNVVETLSQLIEPALVVVLGFGVAILIASVFMPIYNIAGGM